MAEIPPEPFSDCLNCPMVASAGEDPVSDLSKPFSPHTRCCTFTPRIPNYMAGAILSDSDPALEEGRQRLLERIRSGKGVYPNGVYPTPEYTRYYIEKSPMEFGRSRELLCPYFREGRYSCTIWKYREAICALWFCKHLAGRAGREFWNAVIDYIKYIQESLINVSAYFCGLNPVDPYGEGGRPSYNVAADAADVVEKYADLWKEWAGKETGYYIRCHEVVETLGEEEIRKIRMKAVPLAMKIESLANEIGQIPEFLRLAENRVSDEGDAYYRVEIRSFLEILQKWIIWSFRLPRDILELFDGKKETAAVLQQSLDLYRIRIEPEILVALYRHGVLTEEKT